VLAAGRVAKWPLGVGRAGRSGWSSMKRVDSPARGLPGESAVNRRFGPLNAGSARAALCNAFWATAFPGTAGTRCRNWTGHRAPPGPHVPDVPWRPFMIAPRRRSSGSPVTPPRDIAGALVQHGTACVLADAVTPGRRRSCNRRPESQRASAKAANYQAGSWRVPCPHRRQSTQTPAPGQAPP